MLSIEVKSKLFVVRQVIYNGATTVAFFDAVTQLIVMVKQTMQAHTHMFR